MRKIMTYREAVEVLDKLVLQHPNPICELEHNSPFELLIATILSAQCTDKRVNIVTAKIFPKYNQPADFADMELGKLENMIKPCGFFRNKAANIKAAASEIAIKHGGEVPRTIEELMRLPGVGKKTANVVASNAFGVPAIAVDTHVFRLSNRIGFVDEKNVEKTEMALQKKLPKERWTEAHHLLIHHGRYVCFARNPDCGNCIIKEHCRYYNGVGRWHK